MNQDSKQDNTEKPYEPPRLSTISLRPEEAVLGACKNFSGGGTFGVCGTFRAGCQNIGS